MSRMRQAESEAERADSPYFDDRSGLLAKPQSGAIVASVGPASEDLRFAVVGAMDVRNPSSPCYLPIIPEQGKSPPVFSGWEGHRLNMEFKWESLRDLRESLKSGDEITHLDDIPTPTFEDYFKVLLKRVNAPDSVAGERVKVTIRRGGDRLEVFVPFLSQEIPNWGLVQPLSLRRDGFPTVFAHDGGVAPQHCVSAVVDRRAQLVGVNIARESLTITYAIPSGVVRKVVAELKASAAVSSRP